MNGSQKHLKQHLMIFFNFHRFTGDGDRHNDLMMNRDGKVGTVSITFIASFRSENFYALS